MKFVTYLIAFYILFVFVSLYVGGLCSAFVFLDASLTNPMNWPPIGRLIAVVWCFAFPLFMISRKV